jgi:hypothetical protein
VLCEHDERCKLSWVHGWNAFMHLVSMPKGSSLVRQGRCVVRGNGPLACRCAMSCREGSRSSLLSYACVIQFPWC